MDEERGHVVGEMRIQPRITGVAWKDEDRGRRLP
jgi:hypothetical protein